MLVSAIRHHQLSHSKWEVDLCVLRAVGVDDTTSFPFYVEYERGKSHHGVSKRIMCNDRSVHFDESAHFKIPCTLYYSSSSHSSTKSFDDKSLKIILKEACTRAKKGYKTHGDIKINLSNYAKQVPDSVGTKTWHETLGLNSKGLKLQFSLTLKLNQISSSSPTLSSSQFPDNTSTSSSLNDDTLSRLDSINTQSDESKSEDFDTSESNISDVDIDTIETPNTPPPLVSTPSTRSLSTTKSKAERENEIRDIDDEGALIPKQLSPSNRTKSNLHTLLNTNNANNNNNNSNNTHANHNSLNISSTNISPNNTPNGTSSTTPTTTTTTPSRPVFIRQSSSVTIKELSGISRKPSNGPYPSLRSSSILPALEKVEEPSAENEANSVAVDDDLKYLFEEFPKDDSRYSMGIAISGYVIFRSLLQWRAFHPSNQVILTKIDQLLQKLESQETPKTIGKHGIEDTQLYRLASCVTLLYLLRKDLQVVSVLNSNNAQPSRTAAMEIEAPTTHPRTSSSASSPIKTFSTQILQHANEFYTQFMVFIAQNILTEDYIIDSVFGENLENLTKTLTHIYSTLETHFPFENFRRQILRQLMYIINAQLFKGLLQKKDFCKWGSAIPLKIGVQSVIEWVNATLKETTEKFSNSKSNSTSQTPILLRSPADQLLPIRQASDVLVMHKESLSDESVRKEVCPNIDIKLLLKLLDVYVSDEYDPEYIHPALIIKIEKSHNDSLLTQPEESLKDNSNALIDVTQVIPLDPNLGTCLIDDFRTIPIPSTILEKQTWKFLKVDVQK